MERPEIWTRRQANALTDLRRNGLGQLCVLGTIAFLSANFYPLGDHNYFKMFGDNTSSFWFLQLCDVARVIGHLLRRLIY